MSQRFIMYSTGDSFTVDDKEHEMPPIHFTIENQAKKFKNFLNNQEQENKKLENRLNRYEYKMAKSQQAQENLVSEIKNRIKYLQQTEFKHMETERLISIMELKRMLNLISSGSCEVYETKKTIDEIEALKKQNKELKEYIREVTRLKDDEFTFTVTENKMELFKDKLYIKDAHTTVEMIKGRMLKITVYPPRHAPMSFCYHITGKTNML